MTTPAGKGELDSFIEFTVKVQTPSRVDGFSATEVAIAVSLLMSHGYHQCPDAVQIGTASIMWSGMTGAEYYQLVRDRGWFTIARWIGKDTQTWNARSVIGVFVKLWDCH